MKLAANLELLIVMKAHHHEAFNIIKGNS